MFYVAPILIKPMTSKIFPKAPIYKGGTLKAVDGPIVKFVKFTEHAPKLYTKADPERVSLKKLIDELASGQSSRHGNVISSPASIDIIDIPGSGGHVNVRFNGVMKDDAGNIVSDPVFPVRDRAMAQEMKRLIEEDGFTKILIPTPTRVVTGPKQLPDFILKNPSSPKVGEFIEHITLHPNSGQIHVHYRNTNFEYGFIEIRDVKYDSSGAFLEERVHSTTNLVTNVDGHDVPVFKETITKADGTKSTKDVFPKFGVAVDGSIYMLWKPAKNTTLATPVKNVTNNGYSAAIGRDCNTVNTLGETLAFRRCMA